MNLEQLDRRQKEKYIEYLSEFITPERRRRIDEVLIGRTRHITLVLEDIFQPHNASAVLRSCDCFGILDVHIIENEHTYRVNPDVALGSAQWLNLHIYKSKGGNTKSCLEELKNRGYRLVATSPHEDGTMTDELPIDQRTALLFGSELNGLTEEALNMADAFIKIPMVGFTESLNISVSAAICLYSLTGRLRKSEIAWHLSEAELLDTRIAWLKNCIKKADIVEQEYLSRINKS